MIPREICVSFSILTFFTYPHFMISARQKESSLRAKRPAVKQGPDLYLEPKWLRCPTSGSRGPHAEGLARGPSIIGALAPQDHHHTPASPRVRPGLQGFWQYARLFAVISAFSPEFSSKFLSPPASPPNLPARRVAAGSTHEKKNEKSSFCCCCCFGCCC